jgi:folate-dependent phosphoribosylglycinamide formyltransferase PurN
MTLTQLFNPENGPMRLAIMMSGSGTNAKRIIERYLDLRDAGDTPFEPVLLLSDNHESNAVRIGSEDYKDRDIQIPIVINPIRAFYESEGCDNIRDFDVREKYDLKNVETLREYGVDSIALAGWDWVVTSPICDDFLTTNVHPGNLIVRFPPGHKNEGKRRYIGLGWVPSAKAILNGENQVYTSVHQVTTELDGGPLLAISESVDVPQEVASLSLENRAKLLGEAETIGAISKFIKQNPDMSDEELSKLFPIYGFGRDCQEQLKVRGDWIVFPQVIQDISTGLYTKNERGELYHHAMPIPDGVQFPIGGQK